jgi:hypothetical protein
VDESEFADPYVLRPASSTAPLSMRRLVAMLDGAYYDARFEMLFAEREAAAARRVA